MAPRHITENSIPLSKFPRILLKDSSTRGYKGHPKAVFGQTQKRFSTIPQATSKKSASSYTLFTSYGHCKSFFSPKLMVNLIVILNIKYTPSEKIIKETAVL